MVDDVIHDEAAQGSRAWEREDGFPGGLQREDFLQILVARLSDGGAGGGNVLVEVFEKLLTCRHDIRLTRGRTVRAKVHRFAPKGERNERRQFDEMSGEPAHGHGFIVGLPISVVFGHALERFSGGAHFVVEFRE